MKHHILLSALFLILCFSGRAESNSRVPHLGYAFPAGGRQGTTFQAVVGGQYLHGVQSAHVTGEGVDVSVVRFYRSNRGVDRAVRKSARAELQGWLEKRWTDLYSQGVVSKPMPSWMKQKHRQAEPRAGKPTAVAKAVPEKGARLMEHPLLENLEDKNLWELAHAGRIVFGDVKKRQRNDQLEQLLLLKVTIAPDASPGKRELRLAYRGGLTNSLVFDVGTVAEATEYEPNDPVQMRMLPAPPPYVPPVVINGQILPGDVDQLTFEAKRGQRLVLQMDARSLVPFLADAVPGWFQAVLTLYDGEGREIAFADDWHFRPDPVLYFEPPVDGTYTLEIRDSIYRGREDFVYRVSIAETSFVTGIFPLGGERGTPSTAELMGWNLPSRCCVLDTGLQGGPLREIEVAGQRLRYAVDDLPEYFEKESSQAQQVTLPLIVNGRIESPGDSDSFVFTGKAGQQVVLEVTARRLGSPLDGLVQIFDPAGALLAWNDDVVDKAGHLHRDMGNLTHHADSHLMVELPQDGAYRVRLTDAQDQGGESWGYRLRMSEPRPDFLLRVTPSSINIRAIATPMCAYVLRRDGFAGPVRLELKNAPRGFGLDGGIIPEGQDFVHFTLRYRGRPLTEPLTLDIEGMAQVGAKEIRRAAQPADDVMQAFLWRHLAPADALVLNAAPLSGRNFLQWAQSPGVTLPCEGEAQLRIYAQGNPKLINSLGFRLRNAPEGVALDRVMRAGRGFSLVLRVEGNPLPGACSDNLIVEVFREISFKNKRTEEMQTRERALGVLPALSLSFRGTTLAQAAR